jgi:hypothetical protein
MIYKWYTKECSTKPPSTKPPIYGCPEGAVVSRRPVPMCPRLFQSSRGKSRGGSGMSMTIGVDPRKLIDVCGVQESPTSIFWYLVMVQSVGECIYEQGWWGRVDGSRGGKRKTRGKVRKGWMSPYTYIPLTVELQCQYCSVFGSAACEYFQKQSMILFIFGRCK